MNKKQRADEARRILYATPVGQIITNPDHIDYLMALFENHSEWPIKLGAGVASITTATGVYGTTHFVLNRVDGSSTDISFIQCINGKTTPISDIKVACRQAIRPLIDSYKQTLFKPGITRCAVTDEALQHDNVHVDHYDLTFDELFRKWIASESVPELFDKLNDRTADNETRIFFTDPVIVNRFVAFHNVNTNLRFVSKLANLSLLRRKAN